MPPVFVCGFDLTAQTAGGMNPPLQPPYDTPPEARFFVGELQPPQNDNRFGFDFR